MRDTESLWCEEEAWRADSVFQNVLLMLSLGFGNVSFIQQVFFKSLKGLKTFFPPPLPVFPCNESMKALEYYTNNNTLKDDIKEATHM